MSITLSPTATHRLVLTYGLVVISASVFIAIRTLYLSEFEGPWISDTWRPSFGFSLFLSLAVVSVILTVRWPVWCLCAYLFVEHSSRRYGPELGFIYAAGITEWMAILGSTGVVLWWLKGRSESRPLFPRLVIITGLLCGWALLSATVDMYRAEHTAFEVRHHPIRYLNGFLICVVAGLAIRRRIDFQMVVLAFTAALFWRCLLTPESLHLDGDAGQLIAIAIPLLIMSVWTARHVLFRIACIVGVVYFAHIIFVIQSRGAGVGLIAGLLSFWLLSSRRWFVLAIAAPILLLSFVVLVDTEFGKRIRGSLPGGSTYNTVESRFRLWGGALRMSRDYWLTGVGPGNYSTRIDDYRIERTGVSAAHNNVLSVLAELGVPGLLFYAATLILALVHLYRIADRHGGNWPGPESRAAFAALTAHTFAGAFITRHDQGLLFLLIGVAAAFHCASSCPRLDPERPIP